VGHLSGPPDGRQCRDGEDVVEQLDHAIEAMGLPEVAAAVDDLTASIDDLGA
jgi:hypothetical protein